MAIRTRNLSKKFTCNAQPRSETPPDKIKRALDASRHLFTPTEDPTPHQAFDALGRLIEILENDPGHTISRSYVLNIAIKCCPISSDPRATPRGASLYGICPQLSSL